MTESPPSERLRVLVLSADFYPKESGGAFIDWNVAKHLATSGDGVTVVTPRNGPNPPMETVDGVEIRRPFRGHSETTHPNSPEGVLLRLYFLLRIVPYLLYLNWRRDFDLVYSTNHEFHPPATLLSVLFRLPHVSFVGYSPSIREDISNGHPLLVLERMNFRLFVGDRVLCRTPSIRDLLSELSSAEVTRMDGIVDADALRRATESESANSAEFRPESGVQLVFVGRLVDIKNPTTLPHIVSRLPPRYSVLVIGDGPERVDVESAVDLADVSERVHLAGRCSHERTLRAIQRSDVLVLPSKAEAYPTVVFEALSLNTTVLATPVGVLPTIDHPRLTTAPVEEFSETIPAIDVSSADGIDEETLRRFSVDHFSRKTYRIIHEEANRRVPEVA